ncbi:hypothetical protein H0H93_002012, partial [Arthromyces matolae]
MACAAADGAVRIVKLSQSYNDVQNSDHPELVLTATIGDDIASSDKAATSALSWVEVPQKGRILVHCKPGRVFLWCETSSDIGWSGSRSFTLETQKLSVGSSSLHPPSGIQYIPRKDLLVLTLFDGSFHIIYNFSSEPSLTPPSSDDLVTSESLSRAVRAVFSQAEDDVDFDVMNRITGFTSYDGFGTFIWVQ